MGEDRKSVPSRVELSHYPKILEKKIYLKDLEEGTKGGLKICKVFLPLEKGIVRYDKFIADKHYLLLK